MREIETTASRDASRHAVVALPAQEPIGVQRLLELSGHTGSGN